MIWIYALIGLVLCADFGQDEEGVFDPSTLDPDRCESCYGAETEDLKWVSHDNAPQSSWGFPMGKLLVEQVCLQAWNQFWKL